LSKIWQSGGHFSEGIEICGSTQLKKINKYRNLWLKPIEEIGHLDTYGVNYSRLSFMDIGALKTYVIILTRGDNSFLQTQIEEGSLKKEF
jgi:hypothetical protein